MPRCSWAETPDEQMQAYHDQEWGKPCHDDRVLFEMLVLETFQAGLSWACVLHKREAFRQDFDQFDVKKVAAFDEDKIQSLMNDARIIRNRRKIEASIANAVHFMEIQKEYGSFDAYIWHFTNGQIVCEPYTMRTTSPLSDAVSKDLKQRGMKFVGSTTMYAYLQSIGVINGHAEDCDWRT
ncbi:DNA-3-methyladenine glycosylase I [Catenisphaera adipataccumulans]|uniref:DNA-3-methyladenine glycosylase I n=1 Tax=Catenisphaera adipataccumulans TaxID=700500 RepID=A0A7W8FUR5_9FIRM|nr:DNA-3-methyladenine glycosylase I [Catenisphaera adipataccumulans]MBB5182378.1 DNA-3-methyladenine glycosylase I [Catenisphaera adipataccumulans]